MIQLTEEQKQTYLEARSKRFLERYNEVVAETGMCWVPISRHDAMKGLYPDMVVLPKNTIDKPAEQTNTDSNDTVKED